MPQTLPEYCTRRGQDALLRSWDVEKNAPLTPADVSYGSRKKLWWRCAAGHEWLAAVYTRTGGSGCPVCAGTVRRPRRVRPLPYPGIQYTAAAGFAE